MSAITELEFIHDATVGRIADIIDSFREIRVDTELIIDRSGYHLGNLLHMGAGRNLRHNAAPGLMQLYLRIHDIGQHLNPILHDGARRLVATRLYSKNDHSPPSAVTRTSTRTSSPA